MSARCGYSLIELIAATAAGAVVLAVAFGLLHALVRLEGQSRDAHTERSRFTGLADQFRRDAHAATRIEALAVEAGTSGTSAWRFTRPQERAVEYRVENDTLIRIVQAGGKTEQREQFVLPEGATATIETIDDARAELAVHPGSSKNKALQRDQVRVPLLHSDADGRDGAREKEPVITVVRLRIVSHRAGEDGASRLLLRTEARLGLDHRFEPREPRE